MLIDEMSFDAILSLAGKCIDSWKNIYDRDDKLPAIDKLLQVTLLMRQRIENSMTRESLYNELLMAVQDKYPNETRHQTALRLIRSDRTAGVDGINNG